MSAPMHVALSPQAPKNPDDVDDWIALLKEARYNGCGHVRLMLFDKTTSYYSIKIEEGNEAAACGDVLDTNKCISAKALAERYIENYFRSGIDSVIDCMFCTVCALGTSWRCAEVLLSEVLQRYSVLARLVVVQCVGFWGMCYAHQHQRKGFG